MTKKFDLIDSGWGNVIDKAVATQQAELRLMNPFIKLRAAQRLLDQKPRLLRVITRFNLTDFCDGVSDTAALRFLMEHPGVGPEWPLDKVQSFDWQSFATW